MRQFLWILAGVLLFCNSGLAQETIPVTTFTISELEAEVASLPLPPAVRATLADLLDEAVRDYDQGARAPAIQLLGEFRDVIVSQPTSVVAGTSAADLTRRAGLISDALEADFDLGGARVGPAGGVVEVADPNSPLYRFRLTIPEGAIKEPTFVSMSVREAMPANQALTFSGGSLILGPTGLALETAATLEVPYQDHDRDGLVDGTDLPLAALKVGVIDTAGRIAFPRRDIDTAGQFQRIQVYDFASYQNVAWRWGAGILTYKLVWPVRGVRVAAGSDMAALGDAVRSAVGVWAAVMAPVGVEFREVAANERAVVRFGFFSPRMPLGIVDSSSDGVSGPLARGLGDGAAQVYAREHPMTADEEFAVIFNSDFGRAALGWSSGRSGDRNSVSIESVAIHALGHVFGLDDVPDTVQPPIMATGADLLKPEVCLFSGDLMALGNLYQMPESPSPPCPHAAAEDLPQMFDFGTARTGSERATAFTLGNSGTGTLIVYGFSTEGDFEIESSETRMTLRPGESTSFQVHFRPVAPGVREGLVRILTNARDGERTVRLTGFRPYEIPECTLTSRPARLVAGESSTLEWTMSGYPESADVSWGEEPVMLGPGRFEVAPEATTAYSLAVSNRAGTNICQATVEVSQASSSEIIWTRQLGTRGDDVARSVRAGSFGLLVGGEVGGNAGSLGEGVLGLYDIAGEPVWEQRIAKSRVEAVTVDSSGIYVAGVTESTLDDQALQGELDVFVSKYDFDGKEVWADHLGTSGTDRASSIAVDASGVYVAGVTSGALDPTAVRGGLDVFVRKYSTEGAPLWLRQVGTDRDDVARDIAVSVGGLVLVGDTGAGLAGQAFGGASDAFLMRFSSSGEVTWIRQFGSSGIEFGSAVAADATGVYVAGGTETALSGQTGLGGFDAFLRKYDLSGEEVWTRQFGTVLTDSVAALAADPSGLYVFGATEGTMGGQVSRGGFDAFVRAFDSGGEEMWTRYIGTAGFDDGLAISSYGTSVYVAGSTLGAFPGWANTGATDGYVGKILK